MEKTNFNKQQNIPTKLNIHLDELKDIVCMECGYDRFIKTEKFKFVPKIISPNGQDGNVNIFVHECMRCGFPLDKEGMLHTKDIWDKHEKYNKNIDNDDCFGDKNA